MLSHSNREVGAAHPRNIQAASESRAGLRASRLACVEESEGEEAQVCSLQVYMGPAGGMSATKACARSSAAVGRASAARKQEERKEARSGDRSEGIEGCCPLPILNIAEKALSSSSHGIFPVTS
eukprot:1232292-Rhodomonas_salina.1